jgi:hypothetical protein
MKQEGSRRSHLNYDWPERLASIWISLVPPLSPSTPECSCRCDETVSAFTTRFQPSAKHHAARRLDKSHAEGQVLLRKQVQLLSITTHKLLLVLYGRDYNAIHLEVISRLLLFTIRPIHGPCNLVVRCCLYALSLRGVEMLRSPFGRDHRQLRLPM